MINTAFERDTDIENDPSVPVWVARSVPLTATVAPATGWLFSWFVTFPEMVLSCAIDCSDTISNVTT
jgi:hypothetical protein